MNKKIGIPIIIFLLILIGLGIYIFYKNSTSTTPQSDYETNRTSSEERTNNTTETRQHKY